MTNEQLKIIQTVAKKLAPKYTFGYYDVDDIQQEAIIIGMEAIQSYSSERGKLSSFLYTFIGNRLKNMKRDKYVRPIPSHIPEDSEEYREWEEKLAGRKNVMNMLPMDKIEDDQEQGMHCKIDFVDDITVKEIFTLIDKNLDIILRADYLRLKDGVKLPKARREKVHEKILEILAEHGYENW